MCCSARLAYANFTLSLRDRLSGFKSSALHLRIRRCMLQDGAKYLSVCERLNETPQQHLSSMVQLALFPVPGGGPAPARTPLKTVQLPTRRALQDATNGADICTQASGKMADEMSIPLPSALPNVPSLPLAQEQQQSMSGSRRSLARGSAIKRSRSPSPASDCAAAHVGAVARTPPPDITLRVVCNEAQGTLCVASGRVTLDSGKEMTATQFEQHAGCGSAKKWKTSLRILPGQVEECPGGALHLLCVHALDPSLLCYWQLGAHFRL